MLKITIEGKFKEIADFALALQNRQNKSNYTELLEKQLKLLSDRSEYADEDVARLSFAMVRIVQHLLN